MTTLLTRASSINRALDQIGDKWCLLIIQEVLWGINSFNDMLKATGVSRGVLSDRLKWLESVHCLRKDTSAPRPRYHLTKKSADLYACALMALVWEKQFYNTPLLDQITLTHQSCNHKFWPGMRCHSCHDDIAAGDVNYQPGPGAAIDPRQKKVRRRSSIPVVSNTGSIPMFTNLIQLVGDRWTANLIALSYHGLSRYDQFHRELPVATNVLADRLKLLVAEDIFTQVAYQQSPVRYEYKLTEKGLALYPWFLALMQWGDKWCDDSGKGRPLLIEHVSCGEPLTASVCCSHCGGELKAHEVSFELPNS